MIRVGVIGCGNIGRVHGELLSGIEDVCLSAFTDLDLEKAETYSMRFSGGQAHAYDSMEEMLQKEKLDAVHICTPHNCHVPQSVMALEQGISVFMEKPPAVSREQFRVLKEAEKRSQGRLGICFQNRYNETTKKVSEIINEGRLGRPKGGRAFVTWCRNAPYYTESGWRGKLLTEGGGALINQSVHTLDLLLMWLGRPVKTEASMRNHHLKGIIEVEDTLEAYLVFSEGLKPVTASFYATTAYCRDEPVLLDLVCEHGGIRLEGDSVWLKEEGKAPEVWQAFKGAGIGKAYWGNGHEACIRDFYDCLKTGRDYRNNLASCELTFETMMEIYESAGIEERK